MKNCTKSLFFILIGTLFFGNFEADQAVSAQDSSISASIAQSKKLLLFGIKGSKDSCLLYPDLTRVKGGGFGALFGLTPEVVERELFEELRSLHVNGMRGYTGTYPEIIEAWLTNQMSNQDAQRYAVYHIKHNCGFLKKMRVKPAAEIAFSPYDAANVLSVNHDMVSLAQSCKAKGHTIAICSSWNREAFLAVKNTHYSAFAPFEAFYISGDCGILACEGHFYDKFLKDYKAQDIYLIDCYQENLVAAHKKGINTIYCANARSVEYELRKQGIL